VAASQPRRAISMTGRTRGSSDGTSREHNRFAGFWTCSASERSLYRSKRVPVIMHIRSKVEQRGDQINLERSDQASLDCSRSFWNDAPICHLTKLSFSRRTLAEQLGNIEIHKIGVVEND